MYIAVVVTKGKLGMNSNRAYGDWGSFINIDESVAIEEALQAAREWAEGHPGTYEVYVGELGNRVVSSPSYKKVPMPMLR